MKYPEIYRKLSPKSQVLSRIFNKLPENHKLFLSDYLDAVHQLATDITFDLHQSVISNYATMADYIHIKKDFLLETTAISKKNTTDTVDFWLSTGDKTSCAGQAITLDINAPETNNTIFFIENVPIESLPNAGDTSLELNIYTGSPLASYYTTTLNSDNTINIGVFVDNSNVMSAGTQTVYVKVIDLSGSILIDENITVNTEEYAIHFGIKNTRQDITANFLDYIIPSDVLDIPFIYNKEGNIIWWHIEDTYQNGEVIYTENSEDKTIQDLKNENKFKHFSIKDGKLNPDISVFEDLKLSTNYLGEIWEINHNFFSKMGTPVGAKNPLPGETTREHFFRIHALWELYVKGPTIYRLETVINSYFGSEVFLSDDVITDITGQILTTKSGKVYNIVPGFLGKNPITKKIYTAYSGSLDPADPNYNAAALLNSTVQRGWALSTIITVQDSISNEVLGYNTAASGQIYPLDYYTWFIIMALSDNITAKWNSVQYDLTKTLKLLMPIFSSYLYLYIIVIPDMPSGETCNYYTIFGNNTLNCVTAGINDSCPVCNIDGLKVHDMLNATDLTSENLVNSNAIGESNNFNSKITINATGEVVGIVPDFTETHKYMIFTNYDDAEYIKLTAILNGSDFTEFTNCISFCPDSTTCSASSIDCSTTDVLTKSLTPESGDKLEITIDFNNTIVNFNGIFSGMKFGSIGMTESLVLEAMLLLSNGSQFIITFNTEHTLVDVIDPTNVVGSSFYNTGSDVIYNALTINNIHLESDSTVVFETIENLIETYIKQYNTTMNKLTISFDLSDATTTSLKIRGFGLLGGQV